MTWRCAKKNNPHTRVVGWTNIDHAFQGMMDSNVELWHARQDWRRVMEEIDRYVQRLAELERFLKDASLPLDRHRTSEVERDAIRELIHGDYCLPFLQSHYGIHVLQVFEEPERWTTRFVGFTPFGYEQSYCEEGWEGPVLVQIKGARRRECDVIIPNPKYL